MSAPQGNSRSLLNRLATSPRLAPAALLVVALVALWQTSRLSRWGIDGPGPGLFPMMVGSACALLAVLVFLFPGQSGNAEPDAAATTNTAGPPGTPASSPERSFGIYALVMLVLAVGASFAGFTLTCLAVAVLIVRIAEGRSWRAALIYGVACALVGLIGFGWLLRVDLPMSAIDRALLDLLR